MTDYAEPWDDQGHHSNIYDANGDCIATVFNHRARIIACVNALKGINPDIVKPILDELKFMLADVNLHAKPIDIAKCSYLKILLAKAYEEEQ